MDYCTVEQCHAIVNAAVAQLKLDLQLEAGDAAALGLHLSPPLTAQLSLTGMDEAPALALGPTGNTLVLGSADDDQDRPSRTRTVGQVEGNTLVLGSTNRDKRLESSQMIAGLPSANSLGMTPRVKALLPKQIGRTTVGVDSPGEVDGGSGGFVAVPGASFSPRVGETEALSGGERGRRALDDELGTPRAGLGARSEQPDADSSRPVGDKVFLSGYSPEILACGVIKKWVNYGKGWESRILVLDKGVISYYHTKGKNKVNVTAIMGDRECYKIGDKVDKLKRKQGGMEQREFQDKPLGEMHISVATIRISKSDATKFRIFSGLKKSGAGNFGWRGALQLKAESSADRQRWINILSEMKSFYITKDRLVQDGIGMSVGDGDDDLEELETRLQELNASASVIEVCRTWAVTREEAYEEALNKERDELMDLQDELRTALEEKRFLEDTIIQNSMHSEGGGGGEAARKRDKGRVQRPRAGSVSDDDFDRSDDEGSGHGGGRPRRPSGSSHHSGASLSEDDDDDWEAPTPVPRSSAQQRGITRTDSVDVVSRHEPEPEPEVEVAGEDGPSRDSVDSLEFYDVQGGSPTGTAAQEAASAVRAARIARQGAAARSLVGSPRLQIPVPTRERKLLPLWPIVKDAVGGDLSMISLPAVFNEPLSLLQRAAEDMTYSNLIDAAAGCSDSRERLAYVAAFAVSCYASQTEERTLKPFNPMLGETYECARADLGFRYLAEAVAGSPNVIAFHAESFDAGAFDADEGAEDVCGERFTFWGDLEPQVSFTGRSAELTPAGKLHLMLPQTRDHFTWQKVTTTVHNVIVGQLWVEHYGTLEVRNESTGESCRLRFDKQSDWDRSDSSEVGKEVVGDVVDSDGALFATLTGHWHEQLEIVVATGVLNSQSKTLWKAAHPHPHSSMMCGLSRFAMDLNNDDPDLLHSVAPSDSRLRPDQRLLERGEWEAAQREKIRLEEVHRNQQSKGDGGSKAKHKPRWFRKSTQAQMASGKRSKSSSFDRNQAQQKCSSKGASKKDPLGEETWEYAGGYWEARQAGEGFPQAAAPFGQSLQAGGGGQVSVDSPRSFAGDDM